MNESPPSPNQAPMQSACNTDGTRADAIAVVFAMTFPTLVTLVYFQWLNDSESSFQQVAFGVGKVLQFSFPLVWVWFWHRSKLLGARRLPEVADPGKPIQSCSGAATKKTTISQIGFGIGFGLLVVSSMFAFYFVLLAPTEIGAELSGLVCEKVCGMNIDSLWKFVGMGFFYAIVHSFLEEYYWRWFVFDFLRKFIPAPAANILSSLGFMAHHVILLGFFFGWDSPLTYGLSLCIAVGGSFWAWQYKKTGNLLAPWISHMIVDAGIFALGYFLVKTVL